MELFDGIVQLIFSDAGIYDGSGSYPLAVFSSASALMGAVVVTLDWLGVLIVGRPSALKLIYRGKNVIWLTLLWGVGAGVGGFIGASFGILQLNRAATITVGIAWPMILPRLVKSIDKRSEEVEDFGEEEQ